MTKKRPSSRKPEILSRNLKITAFRTSLRLGILQERGDEPEIEAKPWLELTGKASEPVRDVTAWRVSMYPEEPLRLGTARPAPVGALIQARPELAIVLTWPHREFDRLWAMALSGQLKHAHVSFTKPHYNSGLVVAASFSNEFED